MTDNVRNRYVWLFAFVDLLSVILLSVVFYSWGLHVDGGGADVCTLYKVPDLHNGITTDILQNNNPWVFVVLGNSPTGKPFLIRRDQNVTTNQAMSFKEAADRISAMSDDEQPQLIPEADATVQNLIDAISILKEKWPQYDNMIVKLPRYAEDKNK